MASLPLPLAEPIRFHVPGIPVAKARPKISTRGGVVRTFTPAKTVGFEGKVAYAAEQAMAGASPLLGPIHLSLSVALPIPVSWSKKKQGAALAGIVQPCGRPDLDNYVKSVADGGNGILWHDDAQITLLSASKRYAAVPGVSVEVLAL